MALKKINYNGSSKVIIRLCEMVNQLIDGGSGGSTVTYTQTLSSGTKTGEIEIDGVSTDMYAPTQPTKVSDLQNDSGFIDNTVNNLTNYYLKSQTYTQAEVDALISAIVTLNILVVQTLPTQDISTTTIYLVPKQTPETQDIYDEYIYVNNAWEHIGTTQIDLSNYYTKTQTDNLLADKVDKVTGKQLSTEDFTSALKSKLEGIASGAEVNVQSDWSQSDNTADDYIKNKPSKLSDFSNDTNFITNTVSNLTNYYLKSETYTQAEVNALVAGISGLNYLVVQTLPTQDISTTTIYLVPKATALTDDVYDEYLYINNAWECIGSTTVDLSNYYTKSQTDTLLNAKVSDNPTFTEASTRANIASGESFATILGKIKKFFTDLKTVAFTGSYSDLSGTPTIPTDFVSKANGGTFSGNITIDRANGTASSIGWSYLTLGNSTPSGTEGNSTGVIHFKCRNNRFVEIYDKNGNITGNRYIGLPNADGTLALTDDIPSADEFYNTINSSNKITKKIITSSGSGSSSSQWIKVLEMNITSQYASCEFDINIDNAGTSGSQISYIHLIGRLKQQNPMSGNPTYRFSAVSWIGLNPSQCRLYLTSNTSSLKKAELWVKNNNTYQNLVISANYVSGVTYSGLAGDLPSADYAECSTDSHSGFGIKEYGLNIGYSAFSGPTSEGLRYYIIDYTNRIPSNAKIIGFYYNNVSTYYSFVGNTSIIDDGKKILILWDTTQSYFPKDTSIRVYYTVVDD